MEYALRLIFSVSGCVSKRDLSSLKDDMNLIHRLAQLGLSDVVRTNSEEDTQEIADEYISCFK